MKLHWLLFGFSAFLFSCSNLDFKPDRGSILHQGNGSPEDLGVLLPAEENSFYLTGTVYKSSHTDIHLAKYSSDLQLIWEKEIGSTEVESFKHIVVLKNTDVLIGGFSGMSETGETQSDAKQFLYLARLSLDGELKWEQRYDIDPNNYNYYEQDGTYRIQDIVENTDGSIHVACSHEVTEFSGSAGFDENRGCYLIADASGTMQKRFTLDGTPDAIAFTSNSSILLMHTPSDFVPGSFIGAVAFFNIQPGGNNNYRYLDTMDYEWSIGLPYNSFDSYLIKYKQQQLTYDFIRSDVIFRLSYDLDLDKTTFIDLTPPIDEIKTISCVNNQLYLMRNSQGSISVVDLDMNVLKTFQSDYDALEMTRLNDGSFVLANAMKGGIRLLKMNQDGEFTN